MIVRTLMYALDKAQGPKSVAMAARTLELYTGQRTSDLLQGKSTVTGTIDPRTYGKDYDPTREGFYKLGALYGSGAGSYSGKVVTADAALESAVVYACVKIISEDMARLPFFLYERKKDGTLEKAYGHRLYRLLHDAPNPEMSAGSFCEALTARSLLGMDGFARIDRKSSGEILALWPLITETVRTDRDSLRQLVYIVKDGNLPEKTYQQRDIFHLKGFTLDGERGDDILRRARHTFGLTLSADEYAGRFFAQDASPGIILSRPAGVPAWGPETVERVKQAWKRWHQGNSRPHEPAVLQDGMTATRLDPDHQKLQLIESRKHQIAEVCRLYRMQLHKVAELDRSTNNNIEHQGIEYVGHTLGPWRSRWEEAAHLRLLTEEEKYHSDGKPRMYAEFSVEAMQQGDFAAQIDGFCKLIEKGVFNIDEVRAWFNKNPVKGGDIHRAQMQMQDITKPVSGDAGGTNEPIREETR
jgi:HK97 family phage portal protein